MRFRYNRSQNESRIGLYLTLWMVSLLRFRVDILKDSNIYFTDDLPEIRAKDGIVVEKSLYLSGNLLSPDYDITINCMILNCKELFYLASMVQFRTLPYASTITDYGERELIF